jgi:hypothetical protein
MLKATPLAIKNACCDLDLPLLKTLLTPLNVNDIIDAGEYNALDYILCGLNFIDHVCVRWAMSIGAYPTCITYQDLLLVRELREAYLARVHSVRLTCVALLKQKRHPAAMGPDMMTLLARNVWSLRYIKNASL